MLCSIRSTACLELARPRERHAQRVVGLRLRCRRLADALAVGRRRVRPRRLGKRPLGPGDRARIVAGAKGQATDLLVELGALDRIARFAEPLDAGGEAGPGALAVAGLPMQPADLAVEACRAGAVALPPRVPRRTAS